MYTFSEVHIAGFEGKPVAPQVEFRDTYWGYVIRSDTPAARRARGVEVAALAMGFTLALIAVAHWILPGSLNVPELVPFKAAASVVFLVLGGVLVWYARRGLRYEVQIDKVKREVRAVLRNRHDLSRVIEKVAFSEVGSAFIERGRSRFTPSRLYMRIRDTPTLIEVATGTEAEMNSLHLRLSHDMAAPKAANANHVMPSRPVSTLRKREALTKNKSLFRAVR